MINPKAEATLNASSLYLISNQYISLSTQHYIGAAQFCSCVWPNAILPNFDMFCYFCDKTVNWLIFYLITLIASHLLEEKDELSLIF